MLATYRRVSGVLRALGPGGEDYVVQASTMPSCWALMLATCSLLAVWIAAERVSARTLRPAQDQFASDQRFDAWNPQSPPKCQTFVDEYNRLTPQIYAANASRTFDRRNELTALRQKDFVGYWNCVASQPPLLHGSVTENVPGTTPTYPSPQTIGSASRCGSRDATNCHGNARPWKGSNWVPELILHGTRYSRERILVNIVDYLGMPGRYQTEVLLESSGNRAYTHAFGDVDTRRKTFTVTSVRDKSGRNIPIPRPVTIRLR